MKKRVLIIDDEERIRKIYKRFFNMLGSNFLDVIETSNATEATNYIIREKVDIVILDIKMPKVNGMSMFEVIKEYDPALRVIVASVYPIDQQKKMIPEASDYFDKSQGPMRLFEKVCGILLKHDYTL